MTIYSKLSKKRDNVTPPLGWFKASFLRNMKHIDWSPGRRLSVMKALAERRNCLKKSVFETPGLPSKAHQMSHLKVSSTKLWI